MSVFASYLRVYEPLDAFPAAQRKRWESYLAAGKAPDRMRGLRVEHRAALVSAIGLVPEQDVEHAFVLRMDGRHHLCPWRLRLRTWQAAADFRASMPPQLAAAFLPSAVAEVAERELAAARTADEGTKTFIRTSNWQVPLHWFLCFEGEDRRLVSRGERSARSMTYLTTMPMARRRVARAQRIVGERLDGEIIERIGELRDWLEDYHPRALVELDYGALVNLFDDDELYEDESAADVQHAVVCLAQGDAEEAAEAYHRVSVRWGGVRALETAN